MRPPCPTNVLQCHPDSLHIPNCLCLSRNSDLDLNTSFDVNDDSLDDFGRGVETILYVSSYPHIKREGNALNQTLMDLHFPQIPGLGTFTVGRLSGRDLEDLTKVGCQLAEFHHSPKEYTNVGRRTGPFTRRSLALARSTSSVQTFSMDLTLREVRVMRILWTFGPSPKSLSPPLL
jgi:hypothetical protein